LTDKKIHLQKCKKIRKIGAKLRSLFQGALPAMGLLAMPTNNRLGWKGSPWTNTLAYDENLYLTAVNFL
jgi:hypothetical protein